MFEKSICPTSHSAEAIENAETKSSGRGGKVIMLHFSPRLAVYVT